MQNKGGCGKTSFATTLYATAVCRGDSAGILDLDPQGNATAWCLSRRGFLEVPQQHGAEAFCTPDGALTHTRFSGKQHADELAKHVLPCARIAGGFVVPSNPYMDRGRLRGVELSSVPLGTLVVDTPPQMNSTLLRSVVAQSDAIVVPVQPEPYCVQNIAELVAEIANAGGADLLEAGRVRLVFNMVQKCVTHAAWVAVVRANWGHLLSPVTVARAMAWADVSNAGTWSPKSKPAKIATELWHDIAENNQRRAAAGTTIEWHN
jgi:cellulose biosynthesis protein BcsQ